MDSTSWDPGTYRTSDHSSFTRASTHLSSVRPSLQLRLWRDTRGWELWLRPSPALGPCAGNSPEPQAPPAVRHGGCYCYSTGLFVQAPMDRPPAVWVSEGDTQAHDSNLLRRLRSTGGTRALGILPGERAMHDRQGPQEQTLVVGDERSPSH